MKLIVIITHTRRNKKLKDALLEAGLGVTELESRGGFLGKKGTTFLLGVENKTVPKVLEIVKEKCKRKSFFLSSTAVEPTELLQDIPLGKDSAKMEFGGAVVFVLGVERAEKV